MIYVVALNTIEATHYAVHTLGIPIDRQQAEAVAITRAGQLPHSCRDLVMRATPEFWEAKGANGPNDVTIVSIIMAIRLRGGELLPPYDVPEAMDRESVEAWLAAE